MTLSAGTRFGPYEIVGAVGAGGMGEVYRARDTRLGRDVAIKVLASGQPGSPKARERFEREARAVSSLNHPHICTLYDVGRDGGTDFLVMEYLEGQTLAKRIEKGPLPLGELLRVGADIADALESAHRRGVIHRDLKPSNIMLTRSGAKLMDFGLARLSHRQASPSDKTVSLEQEGAGQVAPLTAEGTMVGTFQYMSPEQVEGREADVRSDIFAFGAVLYEMATGKRAFDGRSQASIAAAILEHDPRPISELQPASPPALDRAVKTCLAKDPNERFQSAHDVKLQLEWIRDAGSQAAVPTPASARLRNAERIAWAVALAVTAVAAMLAIQRSRRPPGSRPISPLEAMQISRLTSSGDVQMAALSPDGRYIAYVSSSGGRQALWLKQVGADSRVQVVSPSDRSYRGVAFSPDGSFIYYSQHDQASGGWVLYRIPTLGGIPQLLVNDVDSSVTFSPDGRRFAFVRLAPGIAKVFSAASDGSDLRELSAARPPELLTRDGPSWSPDGKVIAVSSEVVAGRWHPELLEVPAPGGVFTPMKIPLPPQSFGIGQVAWLPDESGLLAVVQARSLSSLQLGQIWRLTYPGGAAQRITNDLNDYFGVSLSRDGKSLVTVERQSNASIWVGPANDAAAMRQITPLNGNLYGRNGLAWTPDGKIVYQSAESGAYEIWIMNGDGSIRRQLTSIPADDSPRVTADGHVIVFRSDRTGSVDVWKINVDGGGLTRLTHTQSAMSFDISRNGKWLVYSTLSGNNIVFFKMSLDGGKPVRIAAEGYPVGISQVAISPDGKWAAFPSVEAAYGKDYELAYTLIPLAGGERHRLKTSLLSSINDLKRHFEWSPDGRGLILIHTEAGASNLWLQPIDGGEPRQLTHFTSERIFDFAYSRDGDRLAVSRGTSTNDAVLIRNFE